MNKSDYLLLSLCLFYLVMVGGGTYEHMNVTTVVTSAPPMSLSMLKGDYAFSPVRFWATFRPLTIVLFIVALIANWKQPAARKLLLAAFAIDVLITLSTFLYFAPETGVLLNTPDSDSEVAMDVLKRASLWKNLNLVRLGAFYLNGILLLVTLGRGGK